MRTHDGPDRTEAPTVRRRPVPPAVTPDPCLESEADRFADRRSTEAAGPVRPMRHLDGSAVPLGSTGAALDAATRATMEPRLGWDLGQIRVHAGREAAASAAALGAAAYTTGRHVVLGDGVPPGSDAGRRLLAHELAHVAQQARGDGQGRLQLKPETPQPAGRRTARPFRLRVTRVMSPPELLCEFVRQYYGTSNEQEVDRRLPLWHFDTAGGRAATAADVRRGFIVLSVVDVTQAAMEQLSEAERAEVDTETDVRFWRENEIAPGTKLGTGPGDAVLRRRWLGVRADVVREREQRRQIAELPEDVRQIVLSGDRPLAPEDYATALTLAHKLSGLTKAQRADYRSTAAAATTWAELDASIERYLLDQQVREAETARTEAAEATLFGCEDLYRLRERRNDLRKKVIQASAGAAHQSGPIAELDRLNAEFDAALARHGFADEAEFAAAVDTYRVRFRAEAVAIALDVLARYDQQLHEERRRLRTTGYVRTMVAGIARTTARTDYRAAAAKESLARTTRAGAESAAERNRARTEAQRYETEAQTLRSSAGAAVVTGSGGDPLVDPEKLGRGTDREKLAGLDAPAAQQYLLDVVEERLADTAKARGEFSADPERIFSLPDLVEATKKSQGIGDGTIYAWIVRDTVAAAQSAHLFSTVVLGVIALVLAALVPGGGWVAAAALIGGTTLSAYQALEAVREYQRQAVEYRLSFIQEEPSLVWVGIAVASAAFELGVTTATLLRMSAKGLSSLEAPLREFAAAADTESAAARLRTLTAKIEAAEGLNRELKDALKARSAAELGFRKAVGEAAGRLMGSGGAVDPWPLVKVMYHAARRGVQTVADLRRDARMLELMGDVTKMTRAGRAEITTAFRRVRRIISTGERRRMDEATIMRYVDRFAAERPDEEAFAALLKDMRAWRPPTQEQVLAETKLTAVSEQLAALRRTRAELEAERAALRQEPAGSRDTARIREIDQELAEYDGLDLRTSRPTGEGLIRRAEEALGKAERLAEQARLDPTIRMRQVFGASKERADILAKVETDQVGPLRTPPQGLEVDHVVSLNRMSQMAGFDKLRATERAALAVRRDNLVVMDASANSSKGERSWAAWRQSSTFYGPDVVATWTARDATLTRTIQDWIQATVRGR
ncbi:DUF4157 domain-containing protein [Micromonospora sp. NPDC049460]|uniref:eCIS core domain-containing protein n=1 Tax=Micromonospora sp. NPDC049460 TaxID=3364272 RepID=UPI003789C90E